MIKEIWEDLQKQANYAVASKNKKAQADGKLQELLQVGDELDITLKTGEELTVQAVGTTERGLIFLLKDCMKDEHGMNKRMTGKGGWRDSEMRLWLNETIIRMLPDELREMIVPRRIVQTMDGERLESEDKLWLPSFTEMFGMWINNVRSTTLAVHSLPRTLLCPSEKAASPARRRSAVSSWERRPPAPVRVPPTLPGIRSAARLCRGSIPPGRHVRSCCSSVSCFAPSRAHAARGWFRSQIKGRSRRPRQSQCSRCCRWRCRCC